MSLRPLRAVLFDLDGVLVDSHDAWFHVLNVTATSFGAPHITRDQLDAAFGQGIAEDQRVFYPQATVEQIRDAYDAAMPESLAHMTTNPEALDALTGLGARGLRRAIVTNTQTSLAEAILTTCELREQVDAISAMELDTKEKPDPDLVLRALAAVGAGADEAIMLGDSKFDRMAAEAAGVRFVFYDFCAGTSLRDTLGSSGVL